MIHHAESYPVICGMNILLQMPGKKTERQSLLQSHLKMVYFIFRQLRNIFKIKYRKNFFKNGRVLMMPWIHQMKSCLWSGHFSLCFHASVVRGGGEGRPYLRLLKLKSTSMSIVNGYLADGTGFPPILLNLSPLIGQRSWSKVDSRERKRQKLWAKHDVWTFLKQTTSGVKKRVSDGGGGGQGVWGRC